MQPIRQFKLRSLFIATTVFAFFTVYLAWIAQEFSFDFSNSNWILDFQHDRLVLFVNPNSKDWRSTGYEVRAAWTTICYSTSAAIALALYLVRRRLRASVATAAPPQEQKDSENSSND